MHTAKLMPLPLTISYLSEVSHTMDFVVCVCAETLVLPLSCRLTLAVLDKGPLNECVCGYAIFTIIQYVLLTEKVDERFTQYHF